jgi:hypothetical protein
VAWFAVFLNAYAAELHDLWRHNLGLSLAVSAVAPVMSASGRLALPVAGVRAVCLARSRASSLRTGASGQPHSVMSVRKQVNASTRRDRSATVIGSPFFGLTASTSEAG